MKYIIEIPDDIQYVLLNGKADNKYYTAVRPIAELEELNSDYINEHYGELQDEAYQKGINDGSLDVKQRVEGAYQRGLNDAWQLAEDVIYNRGNVLDILRCATVGAAFDKYSARQALDMLEEYESKQKDRIDVGDEVDWNGDCFVVTRIYQPLVDKRCNGIAKDGSVYMDVVYDRLTKTGKHYDIASILEAMRTHD